MTLRLIAIVRRDYERRHDNRSKKQHMTLAEYADSNGDRYRKSFYRKDDWPIVPDSGTHETLSAARDQ